MYTEAELKKITRYIEKCMQGELAHDPSHAHRVGHLAEAIAEKEGYTRRDLCMLAGLFHDVGLGIGERTMHGETGAEMAREFLNKYTSIPTADIEEICYAISWHNRKMKAPEHSILLDILADADTLDLLGAVGIWRGIMANKSKKAPTVENFGKKHLKFEDYDGKFAKKRENSAHTIEEQLNFQIESAKILTTKTAIKMSEPLVAMMRTFRFMMINELRQGK